jgi:hypothetical protein
MATVRQQLDTKSTTLLELWTNHFDEINDQSSIFDSAREYDTSDTIYVDERFNGYRSEYQDPKVKNRVGLSRSRVTEMNKIVRLNQTGVGKNVGDQKTIQLFNSNQKYNHNEQRSRVVTKNVYDPITQEQNRVRATISYMINHWDNIAKVSVDSGAPIGTTTINMQTYQGDSNLKLHNLPGSNHTENGAAGTSGPNRFRIGAGYKRLFLRTVDNPAETASTQELNGLARWRFNEGQVLGSKSWGTGEQNTGTGRFNFDSPAAFIGSALAVITGDSSRERLDRSRDELENIRQSIVESYLPGFNRITQPFHARSSLNEYLQQNLLLPPNTTRQSRPSTEIDGTRWDWQSRSRVPRVRTVIQEESTSTFATYNNLYLNNPVRPPISSIRDLADPQRFDKGVISGVAIKDLERQGESGDVGRPVSASNPQPPEIFSHTDDKNRMSNDMKHRGFTQNIAGTVRGQAQGALKPAVENIPDYVLNNDSTNYKGDAEKKISDHRQLGDEQYFPFLFTTENRLSADSSGPWQQACYLQATISNLSESFQPSWQGKHFFGRTEQVHTYTHTDRSIDLSFMIYADDMRRLQNVWERVNWLAQQTYGQYDMGGGQPQSRLLNGPILRMTVGDIYKGLPGFLRSLTFDWNALGQGGKWEMTQGIRMPMACNVQMSYAVIHDDNPYRDYNLYPGLSTGITTASNGRRLIPSNNDFEETGGEGFGLSDTYADLVLTNTSVGDVNKLKSESGGRNLVKNADGTIGHPGGSSVFNGQGNRGY